MVSLVQVPAAFCSSKELKRHCWYSESLLRHYIAHELAHAYLNHDGIYPEDKARADKLEQQVEAEADRLAKQWGF